MDWNVYHTLVLYFYDGLLERFLNRFGTVITFLWYDSGIAHLGGFLCCFAYRVLYWFGQCYLLLSWLVCETLILIFFAFRMLHLSEFTFPIAFEMCSAIWLCMLKLFFFLLWMTGCLSRLHAPRSIRGPNVSCLSIWQLLAWSSAGISISRELVAATIYSAFHLLLPFFISNKGSFQILIFFQIAAAITAFLYVG